MLQRRFVLAPSVGGLCFSNRTRNVLVPESPVILPLPSGGVQFFQFPNASSIEERWIKQDTETVGEGQIQEHHHERMMGAPLLEPGAPALTWSDGLALTDNATLSPGDEAGHDEDAMTEKENTHVYIEVCPWEGGAKQNEDVLNVLLPRYPESTSGQSLLRTVLIADCLLLRAGMHVKTCAYPMRHANLRWCFVLESLC